jgi:alkylhydroperoxidase/carboxymuconolactone decarboxylase family protein YurZ
VGRTRRQQQGVRLLHEMLGAEQAKRTRQVWREICPDFEDYVVGFLAGDVWSRPGLDRRAKSLVTIAALAALGRPLGLELNIRMALNNGATRQEVVETLLHLAPYAGFPACWEGLALAHKVFRELDGGSGQ